MKHLFIYLVSLVATLPLAAQTPSVLAQGQWWKMDIATDGIHRLTTAQLPDLAGQPCSTLAVYGSHGGMLELQNSRTPIDDLQQVATQVIDRNGNGTFDAGDELLFYAEGPSQWRYDNTLHLWTFRRHGYARTHSYYLTTSCPTPLRIATDGTDATPRATLNSYTATVLHENDLASPFQTGQIWLGERRHLQPQLQPHAARPPHRQPHAALRPGQLLHPNGLFLADHQRLEPHPIPQPHHPLQLLLCSH